MHFLPQPLRGPAFMIAATGAYVTNDTMMKLATEGLPPLEVLVLRGIAATLWCVPLLFILGLGRKIPMAWNRWVLLRNIFECLGVVMYIVALANMPIADATALGQMTPLILLIGTAIILREKIGGIRMALVGFGFVGALMVAQPTGFEFSPYALLALGNAVFCAARDIAGRKVPAEVPGWIVSFSAIVVVLIGAGALSLATEQWVMPQLHHLVLLLGSGFFLMFGHFCIFTAYRVGEAGAVAPFYYMFSVWALLSGIVVFGTFPNLPATVGIIFILAGGLAVVLLDGRRRRLTVAA